MSVFRWMKDLFLRGTEGRNGCVGLADSGVIVGVFFCFDWITG